MGVTMVCEPARQIRPRGIFLKRRAAFAALTLALILAAGCGGGGGGGGSTPAVVSVPTPTPTATPIPSFSSSTSVPLSSGALTVPSSNGFGGSVNLTAGSVPIGTVVNETLTNVAPTGLPLASLSDVRRPLASQAGSTLYLVLSVTNTVTLSAPPAFTLAVPNAFLISGDSYYLAFYDGSQPTLGWQAPFGGPAAYANGALSVTASKPVTLQANVTYGFALYAVAGGGTATPTPTSSPSPSPTPTSSATPTGGVGVVITVPTTPPIVAANATGSPVTSVTFTSATVSPGDAPQVFTLSEAGYGGSFTATSPNPLVAVAAVSSSNGSYLLTIRPVGQGTGTISLASANGGTGTISVSVTGP